MATAAFSWARGLCAFILVSCAACEAQVNTTAAADVLGLRALGYAPVPPSAKAGEAEFQAQAKKYATTKKGMSGVVQANPLQSSELSDFWCAWELRDRNRRPALLIDDMQLEYEPYVNGILPQVKQLLAAFRAAGLPVFWSTWWRWGPEDGMFNSMDRFYGPVGWNTKGNALYNHMKNGGEVLPEVAPETEEERKRVMHKMYSLSMFDERPMEWLVPDGQETLHRELQKLGVDTVIQLGAWTDDCIVATAFQAFSLQYDVLVVEDGVSTASKQQFNAIEVMKGSVAKILPTAEVVAYIEEGLPVVERVPTDGAPARAPLSPAAAEIAARAKAAAKVELAAAMASQASADAWSRALHLLETMVTAVISGAVGWLLHSSWAARRAPGICSTASEASGTQPLLNSGSAGLPI